MATVRVAFLVVCFTVLSLAAQTPPLELPPAPEAPVPVQQDPTPGEMPQSERKLTVFTRPTADRAGGIAAQDVLGAHGELLLDAATAPATGILLRALPAYPDVFTQLGTSTSASSFNVTNSGNLSLFKVRGDGYTILRRDQDAMTVMEINNANAGSVSVTTGSSLRFFEGGTLRAAINSTGSGSISGSGGANALHIWNHANAATIFATNNAERMRINSNGYVTVNAVGNVDARLYIQHGIDNSTALLVSHQPTFEPGSPSQADFGVRILATENVQSGANNGGLLVGSHTRSHLAGPGVLSQAIGGVFDAGVATAGGTVSTAIGVRLDSYAIAGSSITNGYALYVNDVLATNDYGIYQTAANDTNYFAGDVGIGTASPAAKLHVVGNIIATGTITGAKVIGATYQDLAEWVPATTDMAPGTVVVLNPVKSNEVMASSRGYDTTVAGVVSAQPGIILGTGSADKEQVATTGRVKVRVDARQQAIRIGDLLVTSDMPGTAMRSLPMEIQGRSFHQPGTIIGKALEPLEGGIGEILVLLSMQ
jgi:hypothetical protein